MTESEWTWYRHKPIEPCAENLWRVEGTLPNRSLRRVMTIACLGDGTLAIHSAVAMDEPGMKALEALGTPAYLLVPNAYHRFDAPRFKKRYPQIRVLTPKGSRRGVSSKVAVDGTYEDFPKDEAVSLETLRGIGETEGAMVVRSQDGVTIVLNDAVFNMPRKPRDPLGWLFTTAMAAAPGPRVSRLFKMAAVKNKAEFRADLERLAATPGLVRVIVAHGAMAHGEEAARVLRTGASSL